MNQIIALQLQIQIILTQINALKAQLPPAEVQMIDWTPVEIATRVIPESDQ